MAKPPWPAKRDLTEGGLGETFCCCLPVPPAHSTLTPGGGGTHQRQPGVSVPASPLTTTLGQSFPSLSCSLPPFILQPLIFSSVNANNIYLIETIYEDEYVNRSG